ncbi:hypothetical protein DSO57_1024941 [Entomophthora muscae]|uniref:Uncharacterized protein n=1 Tax=Entomophthora muscae TaxID=34485 RepID=A0ACC2UMT4_9FUNG|nr:hypothetical protein DSO57_1024941 [Entomophthora muscae]
MHLADVCLYNFGSALRRLKPATYNELCTQIDKDYELFPSVSVQDLFDLIIFYESDSDKSRKDPCLPPRQSICFVKPVYVTQEELEQLKQSALAAPSQSKNSVSPTPCQATCVPTLSPKPLPIPSLSLMLSLSQLQMKAMFIPPIPSVALFCFTAPQLFEIIGHRTFSRIQSYVRI